MAARESGFTLGVIGPVPGERRSAASGDAGCGRRGLRAPRPARCSGGTTHPDPIAPFLDAIVIGDGEAKATEVALTWKSLRDAGVSGKRRRNTSTRWATPALL